MWNQKLGQKFPTILHKMIMQYGCKEVCFGLFKTQTLKLGRTCIDAGLLVRPTSHLLTKSALWIRDSKQTSELKVITDISLL